ncbi:hypothetical protein VTL71DRAFT_10790 [Oculimacula yallundae]|uniref:Uncharacterized protein n=1 Tax=Oculimacula yallundae TaxID=86028 RepID=A0ABR4CU34_9HELO
MTCVYQNEAQQSSSHSPLPSHDYALSSLPPPVATNSTIPTSLWSLTSDQTLLGPGVINVLHLELFDHALGVANTFVCSGVSKEECQMAIRDIVQRALSTPYLICEILSLSATHLSSIRPSQSVFLRYQATELQTSALSIFNAEIQIASVEDASSVDYFSRFVFSSLLLYHMLHDVIAYRDDDFTVFIENFVRYLHVTKGVTLNIHGYWDLLFETSLKPFLQDGEKNLRGGADQRIPECEKLEGLLKTADLGPASSKAYENALSGLKQAYHGHRRLVDADLPPDSSSSLSHGRSIIYSWPIIVSKEYTELVLQKRPEALAILAHYGILLLRYRDSWTVGDGGEYIIEAVTRYLGPYWEEWLASPNEELKKDKCLQK